MKASSANILKSVSTLIDNQEKRIEELEAEVRMLGNAHHNEIETRTKNYELKSRIEAALKLADELHNRGYSSNADSLLAKDIAEELREALGGSDE